MPTEIRAIQQAYRFALDSTPAQGRRFASHAGGARFAYNWGLATIAAALDARDAEKAAGGPATTKTPGHFDLCKLWTVHKDDPATNLSWVAENFVGTYQAALRDAATAWRNFFTSRAGKRQGRRVGRPRFKAKHRARKSFQVHGATLQVIDAHHVKLPKIGVVKTHESTRKLLRRITKNTARIIRGTVSQDSAGRWHIALTAEVQREIRTGPSARQRAGGVVGIDLGVRDVATTSDGTIWASPRHLERAQKKLRRLNQNLSRAATGSAGRAKARVKLARAHHRVACLRLDATHKMTSHLVHTYATVAMEGWDAQAVAQHGSKDVPAKLRHDRNRGLADSSVGCTRWQLASKALWYGATVLVADKNEPTGRTCSACGQVRDKPVPPSDEWFRCPSCGFREDRRINTALALRNAARALSGAPSGEEPLNAHGGNVRPVVLRHPGQSPVKREAGTLRRRRGQTGTPDP